MDEKKKVSVVMCAYNGEKYIREQIDSILTQTYPIYELIIQDDGSTDSTIEIIKEYQNVDKRVKLFCNDISLGFNNNFSMAFSKASGDYIASSDQDDIWRSDKIEVLLNSIGDYTLLFHNSSLFYADPRKVICQKNPDNIIYNGLFLLLKPFVPGHECFFRRDIMPTYLRIVEKEPRISYDTLLLLVAKSLGNIKFVNENLVFWRRHKEATSYNTTYKFSVFNGFLFALLAFKNSEKKNISMRYFKVISKLDFSQDSDFCKIVKLMERGKLKDVLYAGYICFKNRKRLYPHNGRLQSSIKSFFTPLYFIRDCTRFVIY